MNWPDFVIIIVVVWGALMGCRKGLLISLSKLFGYTLGIIAGIALYKPVADLLGAGLGLERMFSRLASVLLNLPPAIRSLPVKALSISKVQQLTGSINLPGTYQKYLHEMIQQLDVASKRADVSTVGDALNYMAGGVILQILSFIILIFVVERAITVLSRIMSKAIHYTPVGIMDQGGGLVVGGARSFLLIAITLVVINPLLSVGLLSKGPVGVFCKGLSQSQISNYIVSKFN